MRANKMEKALERLSAAELGALVNAREITPTEVIEYFASRIEKINPSLNALVYTRIEEAKKRANSFAPEANGSLNRSL